jgi:hypothetical protein
MTDAKVIKLLSILAKYEELDHETVNEKIMELFPDLDFLDSGESTNVVIRRFTPWYMTKIANKNLKAVLKSLDVIYPKLYKNMNTLDNYFSTDIRKPIAKRFGHKSPEHEMSLELTALSWEKKGEIIKKAKDKVQFKQNNRQTFDAKRIIQLIRDNITSDDVIRKSVALLLASGCRPIELYAKANFELVANETHWIKQDFIAKRRGEAGEPVIKPIVYLTSQQFIEEVEIMREGLKDRYKTIINPKNDQLSSSINSRANEIAKLMFENEEDLTLYSTKKLYGLSSYDIYGKVPNRFGNNVSYPTWLSQIYGHKGEGAVANYSHFELKHDEVSSDTILAKQEVIEAKMEELEARVNEKQIPEIEPEPDDPIPVDMDIFKNPKLKAILGKLLVIYEEWIEEHPNSKLTLTNFEGLCKGKAVRRIIRLAYNRFKGQ